MQQRLDERAIDSTSVDEDVTDPGRHAEIPTLLTAWRRPAVLALLLLVAYGLAATMMDPTAHLLTDVGGKTASLEAMDQRGDWDPDIGYWFAEADPEGALFPLDKTRITPDGQFVNTTSLTMVYAARPLWTLGGARAALLLPILGAIAAAVAAGALERRIRPGSDGVWSTLIVGLGSPALVYGLDIWEHSIGLGLTALAVVGVLDAIESARWRPAVLAGLGYALAATMRQEALVYGFVAGLVLVIGLYRSRGIAVALARGAAMAAGAMAVLIGYSYLEIVATGGSFRSGRSTSTVGATTSGVDQLRSAAATTLFPFNGDDPLSYAVGVFLLISLLWLVGATLTGRGRQALAVQYCLVLWSTYFFMLLWLGPRFVPGIVATTPLAVAGLVAGIHRRAWLPLALGFGPFPLVLATAYTEGAIVQWAGRYQLLTGLVLIVVAVAYLQEHHRSLLIGLSVASVFITGFGVAWGAERTHRVGDNWQLIESVTEPGEVMVWRDTVNAREAGAFAVGRRWLGAPYPEDQALAAQLLAAEDIDGFIWLDMLGNEPVEFAGYEPVEELGELDIFDLQMTRYRSLD